MSGGGSGNRRFTSRDGDFRGPQGVPGTGGAGLTGPQGPAGNPGFPGGEPSEFGLNVISGSLYSCNFVTIRPNATDTSSNASIIMGNTGSSGFIAASIPDNTASGGNCRGINAVDFQTLRGFNTDVASGNYSTLGGGNGNEASGNYSTVAGGGLRQRATGDYSTVIGGVELTASGNFSCVIGGNLNKCGGNNSCIFGGNNNTIGTATYSTIIGGASHTISSGSYKVVIGGNSNTGRGNQSCSVTGKFYADGGLTYTTYADKVLVVNNSGYGANQRIFYRTEGSLTSDERLKTDMQEMPNEDFDINTLNNLEFIKFKYKHIHPDAQDKDFLGFSAQNIKEHLPHLSTEDSQGNLGFDINGMIQYLYGITKKRQQEIEELESLVTNLEKSPS